MSSELDPLFKRLHLANARRVWRDLVQRAEGWDADLTVVDSVQCAPRSSPSFAPSMSSTSRTNPR